MIAHEGIPKIKHLNDHKVKMHVHLLYLTQQNSILNYMNNLEIKMTEHKGRGVFVSKNIIKGELLIVERALAFTEST